MYAFIMLYAFESVAYRLNNYKSTAVFHSHCHSWFLACFPPVALSALAFSLQSLLLHPLFFLLSLSVHHFFQSFLRFIHYIEMPAHFFSHFHTRKFFIMQKWSKFYSLSLSLRPYYRKWLSALLEDGKQMFVLTFYTWSNISIKANNV